MPNVSEKKMKLLYLYQILMEETDAEHTLTLPQILQKLEGHGITAERKSIYDDVETLRNFGVNIKKHKARTFEYSIEERQFSLQELKYLVDAVNSAAFLPGKKAQDLAAKLETLCSNYQRQGLRREVEVAGRAKSIHDKAFAVRELLYRAIAENHMVRFQLMDWKLSSNGKPELAVKKGTKVLTVSPWRLEWNQDHYVLAAYDRDAREMLNCSVDRLANIELLEESREPLAKADREPVKNEMQVTLEFSAGLLGETVERFGADFTAELSGKNKYRASVHTLLDSEFFNWLFAQGTDMKLISPKKAAEQFREKAKTAAKLYKEKS